MVEALSTTQPTTDTAPNYCPVGSHRHQTWAEGKLACNLQRVKVKKKKEEAEKEKKGGRRGGRGRGGGGGKTRPALGKSVFSGWELNMVLK